MDDVLQTLVALTREAWDANVREDADYYRHFLTDDALGVNNYGVIGKAALVSMMEQHSAMPFTSVDIENPQLVELTADSALLIYKATIHAKAQGNDIVFSDYVTTGFVNRDGQWKGAFQQHSRIQGR